MHQAEQCSEEIPRPAALRLYLRLLGVTSHETLNCASAPGGGSETAETLKQAVDRMRVEAFDTDAGRVDYRRLRESEAFAEYQAAAGALNAFDPAALHSREERLAFWINVYNALIVHAVIAFGIRARMTEINGVFARAAYSVGGWRMSADDIEHGILRANAGLPFLPGSQFTPDDPRSRWCLQGRDPRIHFALVCGARSCPPIRVYQAAAIDQQLDLATASFVNGGQVVVDQSRRTVYLSRIFAWYASDFGGGVLGLYNRHALMRFTATYMAADADRDYLLQEARHLTVRFMNYDWAVNGDI